MFQGDSNGDGCSSAWTLGKFWALRAAMRLQRVRTVGGSGESRYLRGHRGRQQAWGEGAWEGVHQPARLGPSAHEAQFHGNSVIKWSHTCLSPLDREEGKQIMYHPHWGTVGVDGRAVNNDTGTAGTNGAWLREKAGRTPRQASARPRPGPVLLQMPQAKRPSGNAGWATEQLTAFSFHSKGIDSILWTVSTGAAVADSRGQRLRRQQQVRTWRRRRRTF